MTEINLWAGYSDLKNRHPLQHFFSIPPSNPNKAIIILFRTVILSTIYDAKDGCIDAKKWLLTPCVDRQEVADYAETTPYFISRVTKQVLKGEIPLPPYRIWRYFWADLQ